MISASAPRAHFHARHSAQCGSDACLCRQHMLTTEAWLSHHDLLHHRLGRPSAGLGGSGRGFGHCTARFRSVLAFSVLDPNPAFLHRLRIGSEQRRAKLNVHFDLPHCVAVVFQLQRSETVRGQKMVAAASLMEWLVRNHDNGSDCLLIISFHFQLARRPHSDGFLQ